MSLLFSPYSLGRLTLANRIVIAPMCQYSASEGQATDWHMMHLGHLGLSGAGLMFTEATAVTAQGRISPSDLGLYDDACELALGRVVDAVRRHSPIRLGVQLSHAGRKGASGAPWQGGRQLSLADGGWECVAPSALPHAEGEASPAALDAQGLQALRQAFVQAARRAARLGFDAIEVHAAHGYLLHQFLSPLANIRHDAYGGSTENRMRFPLEVFEAVREAAPDLAVGLRVSATDWAEGGWDLDQTLRLAEAAKARGADFIDVSSGGVTPRQQIPVGPGYQVPFAQAVKARTGLPTMAVGLITEAVQAESILREGHADMVALARAMLYDPRWPWHAAAQLGAQVAAPPQYWRSPPHGVKDLFVGARHGQR
ncbi:NADH:flavin oxidoreductase/NADH oxidase [Bordetella hinzii]|uniref:NADH:flavin oxidoreductase/NADH oxidase n=1 Tax=Bordetella hinzii TaxID=103855 RepID=UPI00045B8681|nr:NADH:flavin oxidoreductase/NADH oxidase [Bordetella hinzii]KCB28417.1 oxidoreductase, FAD/FMN dependent [Bordetella hinzii CA90 BAL1384]KCB44628.1 oxidoreductase, FAD/FMN dependent [Bordetella hinzii 5132]